jgi:glycosyltransferase involved in cell wall biosynthesis
LDELKGRSQNSDTADSVHFVGAVNNPVDYLRAADIFVLPSFAEGMSNSLLEAMSVGLPVIASRIGGNTDLLTDETAGLLIEPQDVEGWCRAISQLLENPEQAQKLGRAAREIVTSQYSIRVIVDQYLAIYERLLSENQC